MTLLQKLSLAATISSATFSVAASIPKDAPENHPPRQRRPLRTQRRLYQQNPLRPQLQGHHHAALHRNGFHLQRGRLHTRRRQHRQPHRHPPQHEPRGLPRRSPHPQAQGSPLHLSRQPRPPPTPPPAGPSRQYPPPPLPQPSPKPKQIRPPRPPTSKPSTPLQNKRLPSRKPSPRPPQTSI